MNLNLKVKKIDTTLKNASSHVYLWDMLHWEKANWSTKREVHENISTDMTSQNKAMINICKERLTQNYTLLWEWRKGPFTSAHWEVSQRQTFSSRDLSVVPLCICQENQEHTSIHSSRIFIGVPLMVPRMGKVQMHKSMKR